MDCYCYGGTFEAATDSLGLMLEEIIAECDDLFIISSPHPCLPWLRLILILYHHVRNDPLCTLGDSTESSDREKLTASPIVHEEEVSDVSSNSNNQHGGNSITFILISYF